MKKYLLYLIPLCIVGLFSHPAKAQQKIAPAEVKKIILDCGSGGIGGGDALEFEVLNEQGKWNSYQTAEDVFEKNRPDLNRHSTGRTGIGTLSAQQITDFLNCIAVIKPQFDAKGLNITAAALITEIKQKTKDTTGNIIQLNNIITEAVVRQTITNAMRDGDVDTYRNCSIRIIKSNNDTLKIETSNDYATMLPWTIDKIKTFDMGINDFFIAAMCNRNYINKWILSLHHLKENIYQFIDAEYPDRPISTYRLKYCYTDNLKLLKSKFEAGFKIGEKPGFDNAYDLTLKTDRMPTNMQLTAYINPEDRQAILGLIHYSEEIKQYLKKDNFVLKYYSVRPEYHIGFMYVWKPSTNAYTAAAKKNIPSLKNIDESRALPIWVDAQGGKSSDWFLLLPDNRVVMAHRYINKPGAAFAPAFPPDDPNANALNSTIKYVLFNADGTVVK